MAVPPKFAGHRMVFGAAPAVSGGVPATRHTLEVYLDYTCPFSAKIFKTLVEVVKPMVSENPAWASSVEFIFRHQIQPWHPSSTLTHEAGVAVLRLAPDKFWDFSAELFKVQTEFFDINVLKETRNSTYLRLSKVAAAVGVDEAQFLKLLVIPGTPPDDGSLNVGNAVTNDLKLLVKMARLTGVHVSPTVIYDGVVQNDISSGWTGAQWKEWLEKNVV